VYGTVGDTAAHLLQLIYDFKDGGASFGLISLLPDEIREEDKSKFVKIGVEIPSMMYAMYILLS